ncbi:Hemolysin precursor [Fusobacterium polymorphum]|uniref:Possible TPS family two-partner secretion family protein TpsA n=1 Tax=Fusobacterium polymorphum ATCC 10953 TaxID=393480 RepID=A5TSU9_FUSNP|nr:hemagglutinin repeat-containing protein [Fusobacterium polymorphum]EDK87974.1 possible TPS family two-partner secretion family protein TpsA [Fusobacterium polymorphum ATCC 10953]WRL68105.1 hemagglutinin repeat-containing protein [Fusobacterium polymorphum]CKG75316.1 Hemolysin precursor [Fusobacterium polymorphum]
MRGSLKRLIAVFMLFLHVLSIAEPIVADKNKSKNLQVDKAANGVPLINIEAPDKNGTSHNVYKDFNVDKKGAILNNSKDLTKSQLGGIILGNPNLQNGKEASTIINEVSGVNKSRIEGYQEIAGKKANYILANPNGIYVNGAGFINTGNVTLTTGSGNNLLNPEKGTIEVAGKGLDLRNINKAELVARVAELSAPIYGGEEVNLKLGSQGKSNKPEYVLDARALGSIYAGRINIIVNEDGVGVKTQAPMYATKGDVVISSKGKVYLKDTQAKGNINISSTETEIGNKLLAENSINIKNRKTTNSGQIQANNNITINGNVNNSNLIFTNKDLKIEGNFKNKGSVSSTNLNAKEIENLNKIVTGEKVSSTKITNSGNISAKEIEKTNIFNGGKLFSKNITAKDFKNTGEVSSETLTTTNLENSNKINIKENINSNTVTNKTNSEITSKNLNTHKLDNKGNIIVTNNVNSELITNNGKLLVANTINSQNLINTSIVQGKTLDIKNKINSSGKILSDNILTKNIFSSGNISSKAIKTQELTNSGEIISNNLSSNNINNSKNIFVNGNLKIANNLNNSGIIEGLELNTNSIDNTGNITIKNKLTSQNLNNKKNTANINAGFLDVQNKISSVGNIKAITLKIYNLDNSGSILTNSLTTSENINKGSITAKNISSQNLVNSGSVISDNITVSKNITNTNSIFANEKISADKISNSNKLVAKNTETINLTNTGNIVVKENLKTKDITNSNSIKVGGNLNTDKLENFKTLIAKNITVEKSLDNINGKITSLNTNINTSDIKNNNGIIQAIKNINITTTNNLSLDGNYTANDTLNIKAKSLENNVDLKNDGKITFNLSGNLTNNKNISSTGNLNIKAQKVSNTKNDSAIGSMANLSITASSLENKGNILFGEGKENKLKTTGDINNTGVISSLGNLKIEAKDVLNDKQIISDNDLTLDVNSIINKGLLYSTNNMKVDFKDIFLNDKAEIYSSGDITINSENGTFTNKVGDIESERNIKIVAKDIKNLAEVTGNHEIKGKVPAEKSNVDMSKLDIKGYNKLSANIVNDFFMQYMIIPKLKRRNLDINDKRVTIKADEQGGSFFVRKVDKDDFNTYGAWDWEKDKSKAGVYLTEADEIKSNYTSKKSTIKAGGNITLIAKNNVENLESNILANGDVNITANQLINKNFDIAIKRNITLKRDIEYHGDAMHNLEWGKTYNHMGQKIYNYNEDKGNVIIETEIDAVAGTGDNAKISAGGNINITATNKVDNGVKAKENVNVNFGNQKATSTNVGKNSVNLDKVDIDKKNINVGVVTLNPKNISPKKEIDTKEYINLPKNDKGLFRINKNNIGNKPGFSYLVETNINFIDKSRFYGSDYFFKRIGFNPNKDIRLLGDSFYETKLINKAILEGTGRRYLGDYKSEKEQMQALYDNAASEQEDLKLSVGIALSKEQVAKLKKDIIWYVEEEVQGQKVLVPKVYLTRNTLSKLKDKNASIEAGQELTITAKDIQNAGNLSANNITITTDNLTNKSILGANKASIDGDTVNITAKNSVDNIGADIKAKENLTIKAEDISNLSTQRTNGYGLDTVTTGENLASIQAKNVTLDAKNNVQNTGAYIKADEKLDIKAKNVKIDTLEESRYYHDGDSNNYLTIDNKSNIASNIEAKNINMEAKKDIDIKGSNVVAKNEANIKANGDINIVSATDSRFYAHKETNKGKFGKSSSEESIVYATRNVASNIIGDKVNITSSKDINLLGSNVQANTEGQIKANGNITQAGVKDINYSYYKKTKTGFMGFTSKSVTDENYAEKAILSATLSGDKGLTYDSKNNLLLEGVKVVSSGNINLKGKNVEINPLATKSYNKHEEVKKGFSGSFSPKGISVSYGKDKFSSDTDIVNQTASQIISNKDINIEATNKVKAKSVDIYAKNDVNISGDNGVEISTANNSYDNTTKQSSSRIGASVGINSAIVNTVENVRDIKELTDFSGNSYDILNNASKVVGAIKDGAAATNSLMNYKYAGIDSTGAETLKNSPNIFKANISYNKSESKSSVHNETVEKSLLVSGRNMNIKSKNGSITISGTDVKVGNDLDLNAKKDITIKASEENYTSSNSSSQTGIGLSADLSKGKIADLSISKAGTKGRGNGTNYINSTIDVGGKLKTNSKNLTLSGANVEADKLDIKAQNVVIESKQDKSEREDSSYGGSFSIDLANPSSFSANINGSKGNGEKEWVNKQTTLIARNGGKIDTDSLTNIGAVIGSESEKEKLKVSANKVIVKDLEDKNKYENIGGGITIGTDVPNTSIKHDKIDKEQINRATAINADFEISGKKTSAEDLGFNTDIDKAQEKTKDEEKHLDAELHTDLIGEDKRNEIKYAYKKLGSLKEILDQKKFKESMEGVLLDKFKDEHQKEFNLIKDENLSLEDKQKLAQNLVERYLRENGYQGVIPEVLLTDEAHSFTVDSKDKSTGTKRREKIYFSINDIADPNLAFSRLFGHEKAHMNTYDEGKDGEETSIHTREKIGSENKNKVFTEEEKADYLNNLRNKYKDQKSIEEQFAEAKLVPEKDKEHFDPILTPSLIAGGTGLIYRYGPEITEAAMKYGPMLLSIMMDPPEINKEDEIDNLDDIKNYKPIVISNNKNAESEKENKEEQVTNEESVSASSPSPLPDPNNKDDKEMEELKEKWGKGSFKNVEDSVEYHFNEHGEEVGANDIRQYLRKAKEFARNLKRARIVGRVKGKTPGVIRYEKMGKYIDLAPNGDIISFGEFNPLNPLK